MSPYLKQPHRERVVYLICSGYSSGRPPHSDHRDLFISRLKSSPQFTSPSVLSLTFSSPSGSSLLSHSFYLWQNCSQYHVQTLSRNNCFFYPTHTHTQVCCSPVRSIPLAVLSEVKHCCGVEMYNEAHSSVLILSSPAAWWRPWVRIHVKIRPWPNSFSADRDKLDWYSHVVADFTSREVFLFDFIKIASFPHISCFKSGKLS